MVAFGVRKTLCSVARVDGEVTGLSAGGAFQYGQQISKFDEGQGPNIELARALEIHLVVEVLDGRLRRHAELEVKLADARVDGLRDLGGRGGRAR